MTSYIKQKLLLFIAITVVFLSYNYLSPQGDAYKDLYDNEYTLVTKNISKENKWSLFTDKTNGVFSIHPGDKLASSGTITFAIDEKIVLLLSIRKNSKGGNIKFTVLKNGEEVETVIVTKASTAQIGLSVISGDSISVIADKNGQTTHDWGSLKIAKVDYLYALKENLLIPFLWSLFLIFIFNQKYFLVFTNSYSLFLLSIYADKHHFGILTSNQLLIFSLLFISLALIAICFYKFFYLLRIPRFAKLLSWLFSVSVLIIPALFIIYESSTNLKVTPEILYAIFQSNGGESFDYVSEFIGIKWIAAALLVIMGSGLLFIFQEAKKAKNIEFSLLIFLVVTCLSITSLHRENLRVFRFVYLEVKNYRNELALFKEIQEKRKSGSLQFTASKKETGETYIVVIGESLNKRHMGLYGYLRETTPNLTKLADAGQLIRFDNAYSNHTHTGQVLSQSLTEANQINKKSYYESISIIEILKEAGFETYWLTNQTLKGAWDNVVSVVASESDHLVGLNNSIGLQVRQQKHDGKLIAEVEKVLAKKDQKNRVVFVHLMGNHWNYCTRYPKNYSRFNGPLEKGEFGKLAESGDLAGRINCYDNSIIYNDYVVSSTLNELKKLPGTTGFLYLADHADDVISKLAHEATRFTFDMVQIPMVAWFSSQYQTKYFDRYQIFKNHAGKLYSNDFLYDTLIGLFGIQTDHYSSRFDLSSTEYKFEVEEAVVLHSDKLYADKGNFLWWQKTNSHYLKSTKQSSRIYPHRVNSIGKLKDIWNDGLRSFEVDVRFDDSGNKKFQVGHNEGVMGLSFEEFISSVDFSKIEQIWFDLKNLTDSNYTEALLRLNYLDERFGIKEKIILESNTTLPFFNTFRREGWYTSYYTPTDRIVALLKNKKTVEMQQIAVEISKQTKAQKCSAISFDKRLYPFIKQYLEPLLDEDVDYITWHGPSLYSIAFIADLEKNTLYLDKRIKSILVKYDSKYNL